MRSSASLGMVDTPPRFHDWLSNRIFKSYEDILDHWCFAWNKLINQ